MRSINMGTRVVSYSELDALRQCPLKHYLTYNRRWRTPVVSRALSIGSLFHEVLEEHYRCGRGKKEIERIAEDETIDMEHAETVGWIYAGYREQYGSDPDWEIIEVEKKFELPLGRGIRLKGRIDLLVEDSGAGGGLWIVDHKTGRELPKGKQLEFDDQFGLYMWLLKKSGLDVRGVIHNACRTYRLKREMKLSERFMRTYTVRSDSELEVVAREAYDTFVRGLCPWPGQPPRATDPDRCTWRCNFSEACLMARKTEPDRGIEELLEDMEAYRDTTRH